MKINNVLDYAIKNIKSNKLRSFLTMLGLVVGISSVILLVGIGNGASNNVKNEVSSLGTNVLTIRINDNDYGFKYNELNEFLELDNIENVTPLKSISVTASKNSETSSNTSVVATDYNYLDMMNLKISTGRNISIIDIENKNKICIIGSTTKETYFNMSNPINQTIKLNGDEYTIVGVLEESGESMGMSTDETIIVPFSTLNYLDTSAQINNLYVTVKDENKIDNTINIIENYIREKLNISSDYFTVTSQSSTLDAMENINSTLSLLLGGIASISLVVGGIGVMNVMLVSVSERTKEIGIRKSIGATKKDILIQFLLESLILCLTGGLFGIIFGIVFGEISIILGYSFVASSFTIVLSLFVSIFIGLIFGIFPAYKASLLNPIDALRTE